MPEKCNSVSEKGDMKTLAQNIAKVLAEKRKEKGSDFVGAIANVFNYDYAEGALDFLEEDLRRELLNGYGLIGCVENHFKPLKFPRWTTEQYRSFIRPRPNVIFLMFDPEGYLERGNGSVEVTNLDYFFRD